MLYSSAYITWDMTNIWTIEEENTTAYLKNLQKPESIKKENINYEGYEIVGTGTVSDPYIITTPVQLQKVNENVDAYYKLGANIDLAGRTWTPIGRANYPFKGQIDGDGFVIRNLSINGTSNNQGLFGYNTGIIKNIKLDGINVKGTDYIGGLLSYNLGTVQGCEISNSTIEGKTTVGGLIGYTSSILTESKSSAVVNGDTNVGGLIGTIYVNNNNLTIDNLSSTGNVTGKDNVGGLVGYSYSYLTGNSSNITYNLMIKRSYATGEVTATGNNVGGLVGYQYSNTFSYNHYQYLNNYVQECYATR
ncbi:The GLUG motif protein [compost metagenome]